MKRQWLIVGGICCCVAVILGSGVIVSHRARRLLHLTPANEVASVGRAPAKKKAAPAAPTTRASSGKGPFPREFTPWSPDGRRQVFLRERDEAMKNGDLARVAQIHADLSQEALQHAARAQQAWMSLQDPNTKLFPQEAKAPYWTYENAGADCYGFLLDVGIQLHPEALPDLVATLEHEAQLAPAGELCQSVQIHTLEPMKQDEARKMFTSSEYVKDGLLSVYERFGPKNPSAARMLQVLDNLMAHSKHQSKWGIIPTSGQEENGNILQACSRLSFAESRPEYAEMVGKIGDATVMQLLPAGVGLPMQDYDYEHDKIISNTVKLRDHGNEVFPGMAEAYAVAVSHRDEPKWMDRADRWAEPLATMYAQMFKYGLNKEGLLISALHVPNHRVSISVPNDTWGYMLDGVLLFTEAARLHGKVDVKRLDALDDHVESVCRAVATHHNFPWQEGIMDGSADSFESAMYMACYRPSMAPVMLPWVDDQIEQLYIFQKPDGFADKGYLDGNYIRTVLMYADLRSGGWKVQPWRDDVEVGFAQDGTGKALVLVKSKDPYTGVLTPDPVRHKEYMHLPWNWPRLNSWPEWFALTDSMRVTEASGATTTPSIADLRSGLKIDLPANGTLILRLDTSSPGDAAARR